MTLEAGEIAPDFTRPDQDGTPRTLTALLADGPVVLFFYPAAMTGGCTREGCHFRDRGPDFAALGAQRIGISPDAVDKQKQFAEANGFDYPLLSDAGAQVAAAYGVKRGLLGKLAPVKRVTFVIGTDRVIQRVVTGELKFDAHADQALAALGGPPAGSA